MTGWTLLDREHLQALDCQLRNAYQSIAERYPAASLRGLWIALERAGQRSIAPLNGRKDVLE